MPGPPGISGPGGGQQPAERLWTDPKDSGLSSPLKEALSDGQWWEEVTPTLGKIPVMGGATPSLGGKHLLWEGQPHSRKTEQSLQTSNTDPGVLAT